MTKDEELIERLRAALIACGRHAGAMLADEVSSEFLMLVPEEVRLKIAASQTEAIAQPVMEVEQEPVAYRHTMHMEGGQTMVKLSDWDGKDDDDPRVMAFGIPGRDYSEEYPVTTDPLYLGAPIYAENPNAASPSPVVGDREAITLALINEARRYSGFSLYDSLDQLQPHQYRDQLRYADAILSLSAPVVVGEGIYVASRASIPARGEMWRQLRASGVQINSSWIDEDGEGETADWSELWARIEGEVKRSRALILYAEPGDFPLKGAFVEAGMALASGIPVFVVAKGVDLGSYGCRPIGSWASHPLVRYADSIGDALSAINAPDPHTMDRAGMAQGVEQIAENANCSGD